MTWNGGFYATPTIAGSRPGATIAGTWAAMCKIGRDKYIEYTKQILSAQQKIVKGLEEQVPEVEVACRSASPVLSIINKVGHPDAINTIAMADVMLKESGWAMCKTMRPSGCHFAISMANCHDWNKFIADVRSAVDKMKADPSLNHNSDVASYGMAVNLPDPIVLEDACKLHSAALLDALGD